MAHKLVTAEEVRHMLDYHPTTGHMYWANPRAGQIKRGARAGSIQNGYRRLHIGGRVYFAHRLIWLWVHGKWPEGEIDHANGDPDDNRISNLREANRSENTRNSRLRKDNKSGFKGVTRHKRTGKWYASIRMNGKPKSLGYFDAPESAHAAYCAAAAKHYGQFARTG
jgi:hypothetical protein